MEAFDMSFLAVTLPVSLLLAGILLVLVVRAAREGQWDDWEGPAWRHHFDEDEVPESERGAPSEAPPR
jgi:cbb3-type cytochrome oxidase maturation protein